MTRAGREPTEDVKRRLVAACQEVGLNVSSARMYLDKSVGARVVHVAASSPQWQHECPMISAMAIVKVTGEWSKEVDIRCTATNDDPVATAFWAPNMKGRGRVPLGELVEQLQETLEEREQVIAAIKLGVDGPYRFARAVWEKLDPMGGLKLGE